MNTVTKTKAILRNHRCGSYVTGDNRKWLLETIAANCPRLRTMAETPRAKVKIAKSKGRYPQKMVFIQARGKTLPAPRGWWCFDKKPKPPSNRALVMQACRELIAKQIVDYRDSFWKDYSDSVERAKELGLTPPSPPLCPESGKRLTSGCVHVDHVVPFVDLVLQWAVENELDLDSLKTVQRRKPHSHRAFASRAFDESWREYHQTHAVLQLLRAEANLAKGAKGRKSKRGGNSVALPQSA